MQDFGGSGPSVNCLNQERYSQISDRLTDLVSGRHCPECAELMRREKEAEERQEQRKGLTVIREDRELLAELARLNTDMTPLCIRMMDGSATASEQQHYAERLIAAGNGSGGGQKA